MLSRCPASACFAYLVFERALLACGVFSIGQRVCVLGLCADIMFVWGFRGSVECSRYEGEAQDLS